MSSSQSKPSPLDTSSNSKELLHRYRKEKSTRQFIKGKSRGITTYVPLDNERHSTNK